MERLIQLAMDALVGESNLRGVRERATMLTVKRIGCLGSVLVGGAVTSLPLSMEYMPHRVETLA